MRDFVESNDNLATKGGPDYPIYCLKDIDDKGDYKIYAKTDEDCEVAKTKYTEIKDNKNTTVFEDSSNPELLYASVSIACIAVVLIIVGIIINILNKKKNKEEE